MQLKQLSSDRWREEWEIDFLSSFLYRERDFIPKYLFNLDTYIHTYTGHAGAHYLHLDTEGKERIPANVRFPQTRILIFF